MTERPPLSDAKRRILGLLKSGGPLTAPALAERMEVTPEAVRQHLASLEESGLVRADAARPPAADRGRGRPSFRWSLTDRAWPLFPDEHADLAVGLISAIRDAHGERGLLRVIEARSRDQVDQYRALLPPESASLLRRVEALARRRTDEGYMAEVIQERPGTYVLVERHCPICDAARACTGLCAAELRVFREALGPDVEVERTQHLLTGDDRCAYRIRRTPGRSGSTGDDR